MSGGTKLQNEQKILTCLVPPPIPPGSGDEGELRLSRPARHRPPCRFFQDGPSVAGKEGAGGVSQSSADSRAALRPHWAPCSASGSEFPPHFLSSASGKQSFSVNQTGNQKISAGYSLIRKHRPLLNTGSIHFKTIVYIIHRCAAADDSKLFSERARRRL